MTFFFLKCKWCYFAVKWVESIDQKPVKLKDSNCFSFIYFIARNDMWRLLVVISRTLDYFLRVWEKCVDDQWLLACSCLAVGSGYDVQEALLYLFFEQISLCPCKVCVMLLWLTRLSLSLTLNGYNFSQNNNKMWEPLELMRYWTGYSTGTKVERKIWCLWNFITVKGVWSYIPSVSRAPVIWVKWGFLIGFVRLFS